MTNNRRLLGIFCWFGFIMPFRERIRLIKEGKFDATSIWWESEEDTDKEDMPELVRKQGLYLENIHVPYEYCNALWDERDIVRKEGVEKHIGWIQDCRNHNIPILVMHVSRGKDQRYPNQLGLDSMNRILERAENLDITIAIENTSREDYLDYLFSNIDSPKLKFCYDSSHDWLYSTKKGDILTRYKDKLVALHLSDNDGVKDTHWLPKQGVLDWNKIFQDFPRDTYSGTINLEVVANKALNQCPKDFLEEAFKRASWIEDNLNNI